ncbi:diguanylate cyclase, partial [Cupriavidus basilensis OR16]
MTACMRLLGRVPADFLALRCLGQWPAWRGTAKDTVSSMESFLIRQPTRKQAMLAALLTLVILCVFALAVPRATQALPAVPPFMPMCALTVFT